MPIIIENPPEVWGVDEKGKKWTHGHCVGARLIHFEICPNNPKKPNPGDTNEEALQGEEEIYMEFDNGKEMRIYIDEDGNLSVFTD